MNRRSPVVLALAGAVVLILASAGAYAVFRPQRPAHAAPLTTYGHAGVPLSFSYPANWHVTARTPAVDSSTSTYYFTFHPGTVTSTGDPQQASMAVERWANPGDVPLAQAIRTGLNDPDQLLVLTPCPFHNPNALECLEITDQTAWVKAGNLPVQVVVFIRVPQAIYAVAWGQTDTFDFQGTAGQTILQTLGSSGSQ